MFVGKNNLLQFIFNFVSTKKFYIFGAGANQGLQRIQLITLLLSLDQNNKLIDIGK